MNYKNKYGFLFLLLFWSINAIGQVVRTKEAFPNGDTEITIIIDLKLATDGRASGLLGKTSDIFFWSGAGDEANGNAFKFTPTDQINFNTPYDPGKMSPLGNDKWSITINPRKHFKVPANVAIKRLGIVIKNGAGNAQTEDLFLELFDGGLNMKILKPIDNFYLAEEKEEIPLKLVVSKTADISILTSVVMPDNTIRNYSLGDFSNVDSLDTKIILAKINDIRITGMTLGVKIMARTATEMKEETIKLVIYPNVEIAKIPANIRLGVNYISESEIIFSFLAPQKKFVYLLAEFNNFTKSEESLMKRDLDSDIFWIKIKIENAFQGHELVYQFLVDGNIVVPDPFAEKILDSKNDKFIPASTYPNLRSVIQNSEGIFSTFQTNQKPFEWKTSNFARPKSEQLIVYELLIRDFTVEGTYKAAQSKIPYLKNLGINAIELMPVSEFTANDSWGYNPTFYQAVDKAYGTKDDLKNFIDECHKNGIAVIIDMVLNHADDSFPYVQMYMNGANPAKDSPFFNVTAMHPFSVFRDFNHESMNTQLLVDQVNRYWLEEFKIDGFRFDLSKGFTQTKNTNVEKWSAYDASRVKIWKRIYDKIRETDQTAYVILEHFAANNEEQELANYGMLFWGNANGDYRNTLKGEAANLANLSHQIRAWNKANLIGYMESHDEERLLFDLQKNGPIKSNYSTKDLPVALERAKAAAAVFFLTEGPKMIWQFGELGYDISIDQNGRTGKKPVKWEYFDDLSRKKLYQTYAELIKLKSILEVAGAKFTYQLSGKVKQIRIENGTQKTIILANFDLEKRTETFENEAGNWFDYFTAKEITLTTKENILLLPGEFHIYTSKKMDSPPAGIVPWEAITLEQILANEPSVKNFELKISPNPGSDKIKVSFLGEIGQKYDIEITDISGKIISTLEGKFNQATVNEEIAIKKIPSGIYFLKVIAEGKLQTGKFLKE
ncbi:MAG: alpha-amylase family glycosyl hydrolase [Bacteroidota bacterium]